MSTEGPFGRRYDDEEDPEQPPSPELGLGPPAKGGDSDPPSQRQDPKPGPPRPPAGLASNATWIAGIALVLLLGYVTLNTLSTDSPGSRGIATGQPIPPFAAPLALADLECEDADGDKQECDASVRVKAGNGSPIACDVRGPDILNSCQLAERGPAVIAFLVAPSQECIDQIDTLDRLRPRFPDVQFAAVAIRGDHSDLNGIIRRHGWGLPVGYDHDGAIANALAVAVCPTVTFVRRGGRVGATTLGTATEQELVANLRKIRSRVPRGAGRRDP